MKRRAWLEGPWAPRRMLVVLIALGVAASVTFVVVTAPLPPIPTVPSPATSEEPAPTPSSFGTAPPPTDSVAPYVLEARLQAVGLPVSHVWHFTGYIGYWVWLTRPLSSEEFQLVLEMVPRPMTLYREYGPFDYPCSDNPKPPRRVWTGWSTGTLYGKDIRPEMGGTAEVYELVREALEKRFPGKLQLAGWLHNVTSPVGPDGKAHKVWLVVSTETSPSPDALEFLRGVLPEHSPMEVWHGITNSLTMPSLPPYIRILCGETNYR